MAQEILINTAATANLIREGKTAQLYSQIQTGGELGMQTLEKSAGGSGETQASGRKPSPCGEEALAMGQPANRPSWIGSAAR